MHFKYEFVEKAHAKINLYLDCDCNVKRRRPDGYHNITSVMQSVSLFDTITLTISDNGSDCLTCSDADIPTDGRNLAIKALNAFREHTGLCFSSRIHIEKNIPSSGGLAGGSSDAAAVLRALNNATDSNLSDDEMTNIAASIGSDIPFCLFGGTRLVTGKGEIMSELKSKFKGHILLANRGEGVSTPWAYSKLDECYCNSDCLTDRDGSVLSSLKTALSIGDIKKVSDNMYNIFENVISQHRPDVTSLCRAMTDGGAKKSMMSGSGPTVMGVFDDKYALTSTAEKLKDLGAKVYICETI